MPCDRHLSFHPPRRENNARQALSNVSSLDAHAFRIRKQQLEPLAAQTNASAMPVFPLVGSMMMRLAMDLARALGASISPRRLRVFHAR